MNYIKLFEDFTQTSKTKIEQLSKVLGDALYAVQFEIPARPPQLKDYKILYDPIGEEIVILDDTNEEVLKTQSVNMIGNFVMIKRCEDKGVSYDCLAWLEETMMSSEKDFTWDELVEELVQKCEDKLYTNKDLKILGVDMNKKRIPLTSKKFKI